MTDAILAAKLTLKCEEMERERDEWKAAILRVHPTGRGTPDEMATDIIEGIEAAKVAIALLSENAKADLPATVDSALRKDVNAG